LTGTYEAQGQGGDGDLAAVVGLPSAEPGEAPEAGAGN
jgi:hypothetical protein